MVLLQGAFAYSASLTPLPKDSTVVEPHIPHHRNLQVPEIARL